MADKVVELRKTQEEAAPPVVAARPRASHARLRLVLLVVIPLLALAVGSYFYLVSGRYISTDNAYIGAQKVLITPDISGKIAKITVTEGQRVNAGDALIEIDPEPFRIAVTQAEARLASVRTEFANLKTNLASMARRIALARETVDLKQRDVERKNTLLANRTGSQVDMDNALDAVVAAKTRSNSSSSSRKRSATSCSAIPTCRSRNIRPTRRPPPRSTRPSAISITRCCARRSPAWRRRSPASRWAAIVTAGTPVFSLIDDTRPWVDANPKETDITHLRIGQPVDISVDTFPGRKFRGAVAAVSPGTGAQFAILPPQNASGNWVKVVQRVPVRIEFAQGEDVRDLRAGMSVTVDIDTGRQNTVSPSLGLTSKAAEPRK